VVHEDDWLSFNMRQNGHVPEFTGRYDQTRADYERTPTKPCSTGSLSMKITLFRSMPKLGHSIASDVRRLSTGICSAALRAHLRPSFRLANVATRSQPHQQSAHAWHEAIEQPVPVRCNMAAGFWSRAHS